MAVVFTGAEPWAPHPKAATVNRQDAAGWRSAANGTRSCCGGWQFGFSGIQPGHLVEVRWDATFEGIAEPADMLVGHAYWAQVAPSTHVTGTAVIWDYVCATGETRSATFRAVLEAPPSASWLTVRATLRWTACGEVVWGLPRVTDLGAAPAPATVRVAVVTGPEAASPDQRRTVDAGVAYYADLAERACQIHGARLVALPEIAIQWHVPGHAYDRAVAVPGPETERFADIARRHRAVLVVGLLERDRDAVHNSAVVLDADGRVAGVYRKVHLASTEAISGVLPGDGFPVFETAVGRLGCTICMDSSAAESARLVGLNGADFLVLPIMGDHRASRWSPGNPYLDDDRWRCIHRTRAMDNQLCMVVARNRTTGSCVIDRSGAILGWNDGSADLIVADVAVPDGFRKWNGGCFRQVNWRQRRPHLYGAFVEPQPPALQRLSAVP